MNLVRRSFLRFSTPSEIFLLPSIYLFFLVFFLPFSFLPQPFTVSPLFLSPFNTLIPSLNFFLRLTSTWWCGRERSGGVAMASLSWANPTYYVGWQPMRQLSSAISSLLCPSTYAADFCHRSAICSNCFPWKNLFITRSYISSLFLNFLRFDSLNKSS